MKKNLYLNYADTSPEDVVMFNNLYLHLSILKDKVEAWSRNKIIAGEDIAAAEKKNYENADAVLHLLSVHFGNEEKCLNTFKNSISSGKKNIPILLSSFSWEEYQGIYPAITKDILPEDLSPIDMHSNSNKVFYDIVKQIQQTIVGENAPVLIKSDRPFYYILASVLAVMGGIATIYAYNVTQDLLITLFTSLMFVCIILFVLRKVVFPTNISSLKIT